MPEFNLKSLYKDFPDIPAQAVEFFSPENAKVEGGKLIARTILAFSQHLTKPTGENTGAFPKWELLYKICQRLVEWDVLTPITTGGISYMDTSYLTSNKDESFVAKLPHINYIVYGFPIIFEEYKASILPIIRESSSGDISVGTCFLHNDRLIITARHCILGATKIGIRGISAEQYSNAQIYVTRNEYVDLAALHFSHDIFPGAKKIPTRKGDVLDEVMVIGYPNVPGFTDLIAAEKATISSRITATRGNVASQATDMFSGAELLLITAKVRGGFSGGPVIDGLGIAIGIVSRQPVANNPAADAVIREYEDLGYGVVIPSQEITRFLDAIREADNSIAGQIAPGDIGYLPWNDEIDDAPESSSP